MHFDREAAIGSPDFANIGSDGKLIGIGKLVVDGDADISIVSSEMPLYRLKDLTFLHPTSNIGYLRAHKSRSCSVANLILARTIILILSCFCSSVLAYYRHLPATLLRDMYHQPFMKRLWLACLLLWTSFTASIVLMVWLWMRYQDQDHDDDSSRVSVLNYILYTVGLLCQHGYCRIPASAPLAFHIVILAGLLGSFILYTAYCGSLVSSLSILSPITSLKGLVDYKFELYAEDTTISAVELINKVIRLFQLRPAQGSESKTCLTAAQDRKGLTPSSSSM
jgi:hypothetical protein